MTPASRAIVMFILANLVVLLETHVGTLRVNIKKAHAQKTIFATLFVMVKI